MLMSTTAAPRRRVQRKSLGRRIADNWQPYVLLLIPVVITIVYKYGPMYGIQINSYGKSSSRWITA